MVNLMSQTKELLEKIYKDVQTIKEEIIDIKLRLLEEEEVTQEELKAIQEAREQIRKGESVTLEELENELE